MRLTAGRRLALYLAVVWLAVIVPVVWLALDLLPLALLLLGWLTAGAVQAYWRAVYRLPR